MNNLSLGKSWEVVLSDFLKSSKFASLKRFVNNAYKTTTIYPNKKDIFSAFNLTSFNKVKVVIVGQDPYHNSGQAHGLSFSVPEDVTLPPSLKNIFKEIEQDLKIKKDFSNGSLVGWAEQGILLINSVLTVEENNAGSHRKKGWEDFTDEVIKTISERHSNIVFLLWGNYAKEKGKNIDSSKHLILQTTHPSPFSAYSGFFGSRHFSKTNTYLKQHGKTPIVW